LRRLFFAQKRVSKQRSTVQAAFHPVVITEKKAVLLPTANDRGGIELFSLSIIILARNAHAGPPRHPARADVASAQQHARHANARRELPCQCFPPFGTMGRNFSKELRRFRWQAQKAVSLPNFSVRGETQ
jgi:hypothetical protein